MLFIKFANDDKNKCMHYVTKHQKLHQKYASSNAWYNAY